MKSLTVLALALSTLFVGCTGADDANDPEEVASISDELVVKATGFKGIDLITGTSSAPASYYALKIDLRVAGNHVMTTRSEDRKRTVTSFAEKYRCKVALNGDFFNFTDYTTIGLAMSGGATWANTGDGASWGFAAFGKPEAAAEGGGPRTLISAPNEVVNPVPGWIESVVGGNPLILDAGVPLRPTSCAPHFCERHPRSAVGLSADGTTLFLLAVDGRNGVSKGATTFELGWIMKKVGASRALNLDGGGSTAMFLRGKGIVNDVSDPRERVVANHIGICDGPN